MSDLTDKEAELRRIKEQKRTSNKKYYENKKLNEIKEEKEPENKISEPENKISEPENKNKYNIIKTSCQTEDNIISESNDWSDWLWDTMKGTGAMVVQTLVQMGVTLSLPLLISMLIPRTTPPLITSSAQQSKPHTRDTQPQITSLSSL